jgi:hypothetical protein
MKIIVESGKVELKGFNIGDDVLVNGKKEKIIGIDYIRDDFAVTTDCVYDGALQSSTHATHCLQGFENARNWNWENKNSIQKIQVEVKETMDTFDMLRELSKDKRKEFKSDEYTVYKYRGVVMQAIIGLEDSPFQINKFTSDLIWTEVKEISDDEKTLYSFLPEGFNWIATDKNGAPYAYSSQPELIDYTYGTSIGIGKFMNLMNFNHIINHKFEDGVLYIGDIKRR